MLGLHKCRRLRAPIAVSMVSLDPQDNFDPHLEAKLDLVRVRDRRAPPLPRADWYLGGALDEDLSNHSSLTRTRQRLSATIFERFFKRVIDLCQEAGPV
jgi:hypothetical protein